MKRATRPEGGQGQRVELANGKLSHACVECGRWCPDCRHDPSYVPERCIACAATPGQPDPYRDNAPAADGRVYCRGSNCNADAFPDALPPGVDRYPRLCRSCREAAAERRGEAAEDRELDATVGVKSVLDRATPPPAPDPLADRPRGRPRKHPAPEPAPRSGGDPGAADGASRWARGGFEPRPDPTTNRRTRDLQPRAKRASREPSEMSGEAAHGT